MEKKKRDRRKGNRKGGKHEKEKNKSKRGGSLSLLMTNEMKDY